MRDIAESIAKHPDYLALCPGPPHSQGVNLVWGRQRTGLMVILWLARYLLTCHNLAGQKRQYKKHQQHYG